VLLTLVASCSWWGNTAKLTIVNRSGKDIDICSVKMSGSTISVRNLMLVHQGAKSVPMSAQPFEVVPGV